MKTKEGPGVEVIGRVCTLQHIYAAQILASCVCVPKYPASPPLFSYIQYQQFAFPYIPAFVILSFLQLTSSKEDNLEHANLSTILS